MVDISIHGLIKAFEQDKNILDGLTFDVSCGERVGILGKNGAGKTTLFRILTGEVRPDEGEVVIASGKRLGLISQIPVYPEGYTVEDVLKTAHRRIFELENRMNELTKLMSGNNSDTILREYDSAAAEYERLRGYSADFERNRVANGLEIGETMRKQPFSKLSGGEKTRVNLARLILEDTDILLLDEPTNHLDLKATEWLEDYLLKFHGTVLAISHDRYFLDRAIQRTIEIRDGKAEFYSGNYSFYVEEKQRRFEEQLKKYEKEQAKLNQLEAAAERLHLWAFMGNDALHKRAFSMEKRMERIKQTDRPKQERAMRIKFAERAFSGDEVLIIDGASKNFDGRVLFSKLELIIEGGERIALIGDNGTGKTTLLKMIMGEETPDAGMVRRGPSVKTAYLPQIIRFENPNRSLLDTMLYSEKCSPQQARDRLGSFRFSGEDVFKPVSVLSGGEQSRLRLCMLMRDEVNFLILDEPTNHLDIQSREWIEESVEAYNEALLFVSHDRYFIERFATRIWALENGTITDFRGGFTEYREYLKKQEEASQREKLKAPEKQQAKKDTRTGSSAKNERLLSKIERDIEKLEGKLAELDGQYELSASDYKRLLELDDEKAALHKELDALYLKWEELSEQQTAAAIKQKQRQCMDSRKKALATLGFWGIEAVLILAACYFEFCMIGYFSIAFLLLGAAAVLLLYRLISKYSKKNPKCAKRLRTALTSIICLGVAGLIAVEIPIIKAARTDDNPEAPYLIVLGAQVVGTQPSYSLYDRLVAAEAYLEEYPEAKAVLSGGQGDNEGISEAECMKNWLVASGISEDRLLLEDESTSTYENIQYSLDTIKADGGDPSGRVAIATSEYHLFRAEMIAKKLGSEPLGVAGRSTYRAQMCAFFIREGFGVVVTWMVM